jgi:hypothetical protein
MCIHLLFLSMMVRPRICLDHVRNNIEALYRQKTAISSIIRYLADHHQVNISTASLYRELRRWKIPAHQHHSTITDTVRERIEQLYFDHGLSDAKILVSLTNEGFTLTFTAIQTTRKGLNLLRRRNLEDYEAFRQQLRSFFKDNRRTSNEVARMGRRYLYTYIRSQYFNVPRDLTFEVYREFYPNEIVDRRAAVNRRRRGFTVSGPNHTWSINAYLKLEPYGFEVYAAINTYSRFIVWFYVGISARTARNVLAQFITATKDRGYIPLYFRSDLGTETLLLATIHHYLSTATNINSRRQPRLRRSINDQGHQIERNIVLLVNLLYYR